MTRGNVKATTLFLAIFVLGIYSVVIAASTEEVRPSSHLVQILSNPQEIPRKKDENIELRTVPFESDTHSNSVLRYALKGKVEGGIPEKEKPAIPDALITRKLRKRDSAFSVPVEEVQRKLKRNEDIVLVDVRSQGKFRSFRIPGSMNIPLYALGKKLFLKKRSLVLVNEGYGYLKLEDACRQLKDAGFSDVRILNGGLNAWRQKKGSIEGDVFAAKKLNRMPPSIFFSEKNDEDWIVFNISNPGNSEASYLIPNAISIPLTDNDEDFVSRLKTAVLNQRRNSLTSVLIFNEKGSQYERIENLIQGSFIKNVFYLKDGLQGYESLLRNQALMWQSKEKRLKEIEKCPTCP